MNKNEKFVITINRELGSGGRTVGRIVAEKLGVPFYDKALIRALEEKYELTTQEIERLKGRKRSWWSDFKRVMINPEVIEESESKCEYNEGCLSIPGVYADVVRPESMTVRYYNENFEEVTEKFDKFACRMIQHEMSHLDGVVFTDLVAPIRKKMLSKKLQNISRGKVSTRYKAKIK